MKIKKYLILLLIIINSCAFRKKIEPFDIKYNDQMVEIKLHITETRRINDLSEGEFYIYYGNMELKLLDDSKINDINNLYFVTKYKDEKSEIEADVSYDKNFWRDLKFNKNKIIRENIYISFKQSINPADVSIIKIDKKFKYLPLDFYDHPSKN